MPFIKRGGRCTTAALLIAVAGCGDAGSSDAETARSRPCAAPEPPTDDERERSAAADQRLDRLAFGSGGDPAAEARKAIERGDFRFIGYSMLVPGLFPVPYGVECRPIMMPVRSLFARSDVPHPDHAIEEQIQGANHARFGQVYNAALLAYPRNPLRDICRPASQPLVPRHPDRLRDGPHTYGFRDLAPTADPVNMAEAARRGTFESLERLIAARPEELNRPDLLGMTPLAWAVAYRREAAAMALMRAGASPAGVGCSSVSLKVSPVQIARALRWRAMVKAMLPLLDAEQVEKLHDPPLYRLDDASRVNAAFDALIERHRARMPPTLTNASAILTFDAAGAPVECRVDPSTGVAELDRGICTAIRSGAVAWRPALDLNGEPSRGEARLRVRFPRER